MAEARVTSHTFRCVGGPGALAVVSTGHGSDQQLKPSCEAGRVGHVSELSASGVVTQEHYSMT